MVDSKSNVLKQIREMEKLVKDAVNGNRRLTGQLKDSLSDKIDNIKGDVSDLKDEEKISDAAEKKLKQILENMKSQLDIDSDD